MANRRTTAPRKRPELPDFAASVPMASAAEDSVSEVWRESDDGIDQLQKQVLEELRDSLQDKHGLDREERDALSDEFAKAIASAPPMADMLDSLDPQQWHKTIATFVEEGLIDSDEAVRLRQRVDEAFRPLATEKGKLVLEFSERLQRDGEASALDWLRSQDLASFDESARPARGIPPSAARKRRLPQNQDVTASKSRRLRGPP